MLYRISVTERGLTGIANIFRSRLSRLDDLLGAGTVPLTLARIRCFATFGRTGVRVVRPPSLGVSKLSVVEPSRKDQQIALAEYSRLVVLFLVLGQYLTQLWQVKGHIFGYSMIFQLYESISAKLSIVAAWDLHQRVPRSILHGMRCSDASRLNI